MGKNLKWKVHLPKLFEEIVSNKECSIFLQPLTIANGILAEVARRAIELDDDKLNELMLRLTLYSCADPDDRDYNPDILKKYQNLEW